MVAFTQSVNCRERRSMSIQKIAQLAGVSVATVSRVLNNSDTVKAKNRERVL
ncbi:TPA: LacI family DNA-binding transcriptional regulator, partial [Kluyvera ascorbata]|nr:LacI family DNA-binding transcriptional regulator [Kluyvera ascorbata]